MDKCAVRIDPCNCIYTMISLANVQLVAPKMEQQVALFAPTFIGYVANLYVCRYWYARVSQKKRK